MASTRAFVSVLLVSEPSRLPGYRPSASGAERKSQVGSLAAIGPSALQSMDYDPTEAGHRHFVPFLCCESTSPLGTGVCAPLASMEVDPKVSGCGAVSAALAVVSHSW